MVNDEEFENFGYGVPQRVKEILNVHQFKTNKFEFPLNIFMQDDQPFLIHETGPVKASVIDVLTGVSLLQKSITEFNKERLENSKLSKQLSDQIDEDKSLLESLPDLKKANELVKQAEVIQEKLDKVKSGIDSLRTLKDKYKLAIELIKKIDDQHIDTDKLIKLKERLEDCSVNLKICKDLKFKYDKSIKVAEIPNIDLSKAVDNMEKISELKDKCENLKRQRSKLNDSEIELEIVNTHMPLVKKELKDLWKELGVCPLCGVKQ